MATDFPNLMKNINLHIQESQQTPGRINVKRFTPRHIIVTLLKDREKSWNRKVTKWIYYKFQALSNF